MLARPVIDVETATDRVRDIAHGQRRVERVAEFQPQTADVVTEPQQARGIVECHQRQRVVDLVHAGLEDAAHGEASMTRHDADRRNAALRHEEHDGVAYLDA